MLSRAKRIEFLRIAFWIALTLVVLNYAAGVFVYRGYAQKLSRARAICRIRFYDGTIHGFVFIEGFDGLKIYPVDYQVYFQDERGSVLKLISDSMFGQQKAEFVTDVWSGYEEKDWKAQGYSNVFIKWLWLKVNLYLPLEVVVE